MKKEAHKSDWKDGFLFLGNELVLDFLNTHPIQDGQLVELLTDFAALLRWFQAAGLLDSAEAAALQRRWGETSRAQEVTQAMRELRERLRRAVMAWERTGSVQHSMLDELNKLMTQHPMRTRLKAAGKSYSAQPWFDPREPEDLFAPLAHGAATLFTTLDRRRVRQCASCVLHFHDTSKKGTRRWCSMQLCGNRLKVAAYAARQRKRVDR
jgi:predicted RNA-binding Zn ribbon-like protein